MRSFPIWMRPPISNGTNSNEKISVIWGSSQAPAVKKMTIERDSPASLGLSLCSSICATPKPTGHTTRSADSHRFPLPAAHAQDATR